MLFLDRPSTATSCHRSTTSSYNFGTEDCQITWSFVLFKVDLYSISYQVVTITIGRVSCGFHAFLEY
ncbi:hypothetical protein P3L10_020543 [Capsicum annuum]